MCKIICAKPKISDSSENIVTKEGSLSNVMIVFALSKRKQILAVVVFFDLIYFNVIRLVNDEPQKQSTSKPDKIRPASKTHLLYDFIRTHYGS